MTSRPWSNGKVGTTGCSSTAEWQLAAVARNNAPGFAAFNAQGVRLRRGPHRPVLRAGQLVPRRRFMMYNLTWFYDNQKPQHPMFPANTVAGGSGPAVQILGSRAACAAGRLVEGFLDPPGAGHPQDSWAGPKGILADSMPVATGGGHDQAHPERSGVVHAARSTTTTWRSTSPGSLVHVVVRHRHRAQPRAVQPRAEDREGRRRPTSNG